MGLIMSKATEDAIQRAVALAERVEKLLRNGEIKVTVEFKQKESRLEGKRE